MSFGFSVGDFVSIANLAWTTYQACKNAGGEYQSLSHEVKSLHIALDRLKDEAEKPGSLVRLDIDRHSRKTRRIWFNCDDVLSEVDGLINKHESLGMSKKKLWDRLQFSAKDLGDIRSKIAANTNVINVYIGIVGLGSLGRLEQQSHINKEELLRIQEKIDRLAAEFRVGNREGSILTTYSNDHKETWKEFRRSLISNGITSDSLTRYGPEIKGYLMQLTKNGMLDEQAYDSDGIQEEFDTEPKTNHFLEPIEVSEMPTQPSPSGRTNQVSGTEVSPLLQPKQPVPNLNSDTRHSLTGSTVPEIPSATDATRFTLPYRRIGGEQKQDLKPDTFQHYVKEAVPKRAAELTSAVSEPAVNQPLSNMDGSSSNHSQLGYRAEGNDRGLGTGPSTHSVERFSPSASTSNAFTIPAAELISVLTDAASDENSETSSVKENKLSSSYRPVSGFEPDQMLKPATEPESDSIENISSEKPDRLPRVLSSDILYTRHRPRIRRDPRGAMTERLRTDQEMAKTERRRVGNDRMREETDSEDDEATGEREKAQMHEEMYKEHEPIRTREKITKAQGEEVDKLVTLAAQKVLRAHRRRRSKSPAQDGRFYIQDRSRCSNEYVNEYVAEGLVRSAMLHVAPFGKKGEPNEGERMHEGTDDEATRKRENARGEREEAQMGEEMYKEHEPIRGREKTTKAQGEVDRPAEQQRRRTVRYRERRGDRDRNPAPKTDVISRTAVVAAVIMAGMTIKGALDRRRTESEENLQYQVHRPRGGSHSVRT